MKLMENLSLAYIRTKFKLLSLFFPKLAAEKAFDLFCTPYMKAKKRTPTIFKIAEPLNFKLNGLKVKGYRWNHNQPNKVLILHGFGSAAHKFNRYIEPLLDKGYEVLAFDAPAHGSSEGKTINAVEYCKMIEQVIRWYGPINGFIAHSFGAMALSLAMERTKHTDQSKIVFIAPATETSSAVDGAFKMLRLKNHKVRTEFDKIIYKLTGHQTEWFSINRAMQNIKSKVLWIHDEEDYVTPLEDALKVKEKEFPNIDFIITKGLGHRRIYRDSEIKKSIIEFL